LVEDGTITLIGATTENPSFEINNALLSRCRVYTLQKLPVESVQQILQRALKDNGHGTLSLCSDICSKIIAENAAIDYLAEQCAGDARIALNSLEMAIQAATSDENGVITLREEQVKEGFKRCHILYDRNADLHYDCISAFHKSIRGSDPNAALYWLGRMLEGGENPLYVARRLIRIASEDIGLADPTALQQAVAAYHACHFIGKLSQSVM
jgi:putative ATPase